MNLRPVSTLALASTVALLAVDRAPAAVLCVSPHGLVRVREKCKRKETARTLGVQGPQGRRAATPIRQLLP